MQVQTLTDLLRADPYPGRGIMLGRSADGKCAVIAYFIMGRSENSRNRVFEETEDGIRTRAFDESKMTDPSLIIYHPVRRMDNGVIIVTTKQAKSGQVSVSYDGYVTLGMRSQHPDFRSGDNYYEARRLAAVNAGMWTGPTDDESLFDSPEAYAAYKAGRWTDYEKLLQKDVTLSHKHTVSVSGGTEKTAARFSLGYAGNGSKWEKSDGSKRYTLRSSIDHKFYDWINAGVNFQLTHNRSKNSPYQAASTTGMQLGSPYDEEGVLVTYPLGAAGYVNPLIDGAGTKLYSAESYSTNVVANAYVDIRPVKGLTIRSQFNTHLTNASSGSY